MWQPHDSLVLGTSLVPMALAKITTLLVNPGHTLHLLLNLTEADDTQGLLLAFETLFPWLP